MDNTNNFHTTCSINWCLISENLSNLSTNSDKYLLIIEYNPIMEFLSFLNSSFFNSLLHTTFLLCSNYIKNNCEEKFLFSLKTEKIIDKKEKKI